MPTTKNFWKAQVGGYRPSTHRALRLTSLYLSVNTKQMEDLSLNYDCNDPDNPDTLATEHEELLLASGSDTPAPPRRTEKKRTLLDHFHLENDNQYQCGDEDETNADAATIHNASETAMSSSTLDTSAVNQELQALTEDEKKVVNGPSSVIWYFFEKKIGISGEETGVCESCAKIRKTPTGTTSTLINHLKKHPFKWKQYEKLSLLKKQLSMSNSQAKKQGEDLSQTKLLSGSFGVLPASSKRAKEITRAVGIFLVKGLHSYSIVNEPGFKHLIGKLERRYVVPHRTTFSRSVIPNLYKEEKQRQAELLKSSLNMIESVTLISDLWTSRALDAFISCDIQYILCTENKFDLLNMTIDCKPFRGSHTAVRICEVAMQMIEDAGIDPEKVKIYFVSDNGSNIVAALEQPSADKIANVNVPNILREEKPWTHLRCFDHTLQLAISDTRKEIGTNTVVEKAAAIVSRYSYSSVARDNLKKFQEQTGTVSHEIIRNVITRWNSEYAMLERFLEQKIPITMELASAGEENLSATQWKMVEGYVKVLKPIAQFTAELGSTTQPTLSMVIPVLYEIITSLEDFTRKPSNKGSGVIFARTLLKYVNERFPENDYKSNHLYQMATLLDPRFKDLLMPNRYEAGDLLEREALRKLRENNLRGRSIPVVLTNRSPSPNISPTPAKQSKWGHLSKISNARKNDNNADEYNIISKEVETYLGLPVIDANSDDPLVWWKANMNSFPLLTYLAAEYLGIAATEVQSERDFSIGSNTVTPKRVILLSEHVRQFVFLHRNLKVPTPIVSKQPSVFEENDNE